MENKPVVKYKNYLIVNKIKEAGLLIGNFHGSLCAEAIDPLLNDVQEIEQQHPEGFNRFSNLSGITETTLTSDQVHSIAYSRQKHYQGPAVKSAIYTPDPLTYGMARIYAAMVYPAPIEVMVFYNKEEAAQWLDVPLEVIAD